MRISFKLGIAWTVTRKRFTGTKTGNANGQRVPNCAKQQKTGLRVDGNAKTANGGKNVERVRQRPHACGTGRNSTNLGSAWMDRRKRSTGTKTCNVNGQHVNGDEYV